MSSRSLFPIKGLHSLIAVLFVLNSGLIYLSSTFYPVSHNDLNESQLIDIADKIDRPLADSINLFGYNTAIQILFSAKAINPSLDFHLYKKVKNDELQLVSQTLTKQLIPSLLNKTIDLPNMLIRQHLLEVNGNVMGLLVIEYTRSEKNYTLFALMATLSFAMFILTLVVLPIFVNKRIKENTARLENEINLITDKKDYHLTVSTDLGIGLNKIAILINQLLNSVKESESLHLVAEDKLHGLQLSLENQIMSRTQELEKAITSAQQANETKTTFLATMSHEIRTPMNGIIGTIDLLRHTELSGPQVRLSSIIRDSAFSLLGILDDILDFSKIEAGKLKVDLIPLSVQQIVEEVARVMSSIAHKNALELNLFIDPNIPEGLLGDPIRVRQVIYNLCSNAIKFTNSTNDKQGKVSIDVTLSQKTHDFNTVDFKISDNGRGMTKQQLGRIFQPFSQAEDSITREFGGTGLGLSICKSLTELMYGQIKVTSEPGIGSEFLISIPFTLGDEAKVENKNRLRGKHVALYSPDKLKNQQLKHYLDFLGATVFEFTELEESNSWQSTEKLIWLLDGVSDMEAINKQLRRLAYLLEEHNQQVIVLSKLSEAKLTCKNVFYLNALPLCKSNLFNSLLIAAGLHQPKAIQLAKAINQYQSVESALKNNQLILLVEDNIMNQQVITDQLHLLGYGVEVANDGEQGFEMWLKGNYSLILTDLHMPKMSGYDLTKRIRQEGPYRTDLTKDSIIIAITANALKGEREKCLAYGMNDYITKPVELNVLEKIVTQWLPIEAPKQTPAPVNLERLTSYIGEDKSQHQHFLTMFLEHGNSIILQIKNAVKHDQTDEIQAVAHQLKSIAKTIGAFKLAESANLLELECEKPTVEPHAVGHLRDDIEQHFFEVQEYINQLLQKE
ncbi:hybrid sensor histidine kinase/response regulator [Pseudoalteromonas tunicata]|jgi:signal transduction histidine kinase/DNA-binding response OmpR family regulator|uniref:Sensory/regulatory protein RpfC n=1 Tax=Pseudoalteromonas tunicata D2 TaxID=87626 RepID=A4CCL0_9GAMM|nr:ATP-binding protein [Pseudoalteromonas tunicata]ATC93804.1 hypothetical protein PTUN_a1122 [Pseudoalteromonas tunicata]AXT29624.1 hybrid sensor histidine kinase/response regulator [Pseudoalteromonas tunicata]EAR27303.1 putative sensory box histidine kinase/response regulator [Pseudoalteromonas tunicata D2]MDP4985626.1 ATP-binding protein [Pseudoalteromonas tunicata]